MLLSYLVNCFIISYPFSLVPFFAHQLNQYGRLSYIDCVNMIWGSKVPTCLSVHDIMKNGCSPNQMREKKRERSDFFFIHNKHPKFQEREFKYSDLNNSSRLNISNRFSLLIEMSGLSCQSHPGAFSRWHKETSLSDKRWNISASRGDIVFTQ